jgi:hypothetical protein
MLTHSVSSLWILAVGCSLALAQTAPGGTAAFRVRSGFTVGLNADQGWAGALNENVAIPADRPFRLRFEVEPPATSATTQRFGLQYRRNGGDWTVVEAHAFPKPEAELRLNFDQAPIGTAPPGWQLAPDRAADFAVAADGDRRILRARAAREPFIAHYPPPWESAELTLAADLRLPVENRAGAGLVFGDIAARDFLRVLLDPTAGVIRVSRFRKETETVVTERKAGLAPGRWLNLEAQYEGDQLQVKLDGDTFEFTVRVGPDIPRTQIGVFVPAESAVDFRRFVLEGEPKTPPVSIVACPAYENGAATTDLLRGSTAAFQPGVGISLAPRTAPQSSAASQREFEWALVLRRFADRAITNEDGDTFEFRMVDGTGAPATARNPSLRFHLPPGHLGGTFIETPGRIGPWRTASGDLYFVMEPSETDNLFMMVKSTDGGRTWREVDGAHRPATRDLESVEGRQTGDTIHLIHQVTRSSRYHSFRTSDHPTHPDTWHIRDEKAGAAVSVAQSATLVVRSDGSMVTFCTGSTIHYAVRSPAGQWSAETIIDRGMTPNLAGPKAELGANDTVHLAYYGMDGTIWYRRLLRDGTLTPRQQLASGVGATRKEFGAVLPLVFIPQTNTLVILYQQADGKLWERRIVNEGPPSAPVPVTDRAVVRDAVDSQQPGADAVLHGETVHVLFIDAATRSLFSTHDRGGWQTPVQQVGDILGSWVRGSVYPRKDGANVYGFVYDAGSLGGSGMNRYGEVPLR